MGDVTIIDVSTKWPVGAAFLRRLERARHIRLSVGLGRGQRRKRTFYVRPDLGI
jgi:hypothetical protein